MKAISTSVTSFAVASETERTIQLTRERKRLFSFIRKRVAQPEDAEDIVQDVLYQFAQTLELPEPVEHVSNWLFRVARNKITDWYRKKKTESFSSMQVKAEDEEEGMLNFLQDILPDATALPDTAFANEMLWEALEQALGELPKEQQEVFVQHEFEGRNFKEIAAETGVTVNTLLSRKRYAVLYLREKMEAFYNEMFND